MNHVIDEPVDIAHVALRQATIVVATIGMCVLARPVVEALFAAEPSTAAELLLGLVVVFTAVYALTRVLAAIMNRPFTCTRTWKGM